MAAPPPAHHSTVVPCFYGSLGFLHKHSWLWISSLPSSQAVSSAANSSFAPRFALQSACSSSQRLPPPPVCTSRHTSQSGAPRAVARTICVVLTLSYLPQTSRFILLQQPQMLPFCPN